MREGKIFYNNDGKQVGIYTTIYEDNYRFFPKIKNMEEISLGTDYVRASKIDADNNRFTTGQSMSSTGVFKYYVKLQIDYNFIAGISVDGIFYKTFIPKSELFDSRIFNIFEFSKGGYIPNIFALDENNIYLMNTTIDFTLHYGTWNVQI